MIAMRRREGGGQGGIMQPSGAGRKGVGLMSGREGICSLCLVVTYAMGCYVYGVAVTWCCDMVL